MFISHNMANIFLASHILLLFHSPKGSWSKSAKYEKLGKYWSYCTRNRAITNAYVKKKLISCITLSLSFFLLIFLCTLNITKNQKHLPSTFTSEFLFRHFCTDYFYTEYHKRYSHIRTKYGEVRSKYGPENSEYGHFSHKDYVAIMSQMRSLKLMPVSERLNKTCEL